MRILSTLTCAMAALTAALAQTATGIPAKAREMLIQLGDWMKVNGEAIYGTRPWQINGEGPTRNSGGGFSELKDRPYTAETSVSPPKNGSLYAIALDWPASGKLLIRSVAGNGSRVSLLGNPGGLKLSRSAEGLTVELPVRKPCDHAFVFKIAGKGLTANPQVQE